MSAMSQTTTRKGPSRRTVMATGVSAAGGLAIGVSISQKAMAAAKARTVSLAASETVPEALARQLAEDGVMVLPLGPHAGAQSLVRLTKSTGEMRREELIPVRFVPLLPGKAREL